MLYVLLFALFFVLFLIMIGPVETFDDTNAPTSTPTPSSPMTREQYLEDMVKYLTIVVNINSARDEVYRLSTGYAQTFSSPRLDALEKQRLYYIDKIKKNPDELAFFRANLNVLY